MAKCFYHAKTSAATVCIGCKMAVCQTCSDEGTKGYCDTCLKKTATLGSRADSLRQTLARQAEPPAIEPEAAEPPAAPRPGARHCQAHPNLMASVGCVTCKRAYCPACLNTQGICAPCALYSEEARSRMSAPTERARRLAGSGVSQGASATAGREQAGPNVKLKRLAIAALAAVALLVGSGALLKRLAPPKAPDSAARETWKSTPLTAEEKAILAKLESDAKRAVPIQDAPPDTAPAEAREAYRAPGRPYVAPAPAAAPRRVGSARVRIGVIQPRAGAVLSGMSTITASVSGRPSRVELYVDGEWQGAIDSPPYSFDWASQAVSNGRHRVTVEAIAEDGRKASSGVNVTVQN